MGKGDKRRQEDATAVRNNWWTEDPHEKLRKHRAHIERTRLTTNQKKDR